MAQTATPQGAFYAPQPYKISYDTARWPWQDVVLQALKLRSLKFTGLVTPLLTRESDTHTILHSRFFRAFEADNCGLHTLYRRFVRECILPRWGLSVAVMQTVPDFRVQTAGNVAVGEFHTDYGHHPCEQNFWLPFTDTDEHNCVWIESEPGKGDYSPYPVRYGEILVFPGAVLTHGNMPNRSHDRVSIDFRLSLPETFTASGLKTINGHKSFTLGAPDSLFELITTEK
jgi:hypothetical protein